MVRRGPTEADRHRFRGYGSRPRPRPLIDPDADDRAPRSSPSGPRPRSPRARACSPRSRPRFPSRSAAGATAPLRTPCSLRRRADARAVAGDRDRGRRGRGDGERVRIGEEAGSTGACTASSSSRQAVAAPLVPAADEAVLATAARRDRSGRAPARRGSSASAAPCPSSIPTRSCGTRSARRAGVALIALVQFLRELTAESRGTAPPLRAALCSTTRTCAGAATASSTTRGCSRTPTRTATTRRWR